MENYKTIKELADELGFSKAYIDKTIRILGMHTKLSKVGNKYVIDFNQEKELKKAIGSKKSQTESHTGTHNESNTESEIFFLRKQLENKNKELEKMQKLLDQQQQLTLQSNKQIEQLQNQLMLLAPQKEESEKEEVVSDNHSQNVVEEEDLQVESVEEDRDEKKWWQFWK